MPKIKGTLSKNAVITIIDPETKEVLLTQQVTAGEFTIENLPLKRVDVIAKNDEGQIQSFGDVKPVDEEDK